MRAVIHDDCYAKLPERIKTRFYPVADDAEITHTVDSSDGEGEGVEKFTLLAVAGAQAGLDLLLGNEDTPTENYSIGADAPAADPGPDLGGDFGGGSGDGGGAEGTF